MKPVTKKDDPKIRNLDTKFGSRSNSLIIFKQSASDIAANKHQGLKPVQSYDRYSPISYLRFLRNMQDKSDNQEKDRFAESKSEGYELDNRPLFHLRKTYGARPEKPSLLPYSRRRK